MKHLIVAVVASLSACQRAPCGSTQGFVWGIATGPGEVTVEARAEDGTTVTASAGPRGVYELNLEGGTTWTLAARAEAEEADTGSFGGTVCWSEDVELAIEACAEHTINLDASECATADKPNLYLYPDAPTEAQVVLRHDPRQVVFASEPPYDVGWTGTAWPDGTFTTAQGALAPFLFYEITLLPAQVRKLQRETAVCIAGDAAVTELAALLAAWGFTQRERDDFVAAWKEDLPRRRSWTVWPQVEVDHAVAVDIAPAMPLHRLWLLMADGEGCVPSNATPTPFPRAGSHAVEWGVVLLRR